MQDINLKSCRFCLKNLGLAYHVIDPSLAKAYEQLTSKQVIIGLIQEKRMVCEIVLSYFVTATLFVRFATKCMLEL